MFQQHRQHLRSSSSAAIVAPAPPPATVTAGAAIVRKKRSEGKSIKLAPFKLRFSKTSKSRNGGSKGSRSNSTESEDPCQQQQQQHSSNSSQLVTSETYGTDGNSLVTRSDSMVPNLPPPSYEHVLEETRMEQSADNEEEEDDEERDEYRGRQQQATRKDKNPVGGERGGNEGVAGGGGSAGGGGGSGPGGGERQPVKGTEILHKSSKEFYKAVAKQWGITCKMSDHCRCLDCQSHYFDCEYEKDEHEKTDGGLGAGTPMFISGMIHGTACVLL